MGPLDARRSTLDALEAAGVERRASSEESR
jgi:hypothetical protein